jgi:hypothetical protein
MVPFGPCCPILSRASAAFPTVAIADHRRGGGHNRGLPRMARSSGGGRCCFRPPAGAGAVEPERGFSYLGGCSACGTNLGNRKRLRSCSGLKRGIATRSAHSSSRTIVDCCTTSGGCWVKPKKHSTCSRKCGRARTEICESYNHREHFVSGSEIAPNTRGTAGGNDPRVAP